MQINEIFHNFHLLFIQEQLISFNLGHFLLSLSAAYEGFLTIFPTLQVFPENHNS